MVENLPKTEQRSVDSQDEVVNTDRGPREYQTSVNRMLVDLKKLDHYDDPFAQLDRLRNTLEECS